MNLTKGIELIKKYEKCILSAYKCSAGKWTIGWGTTNADKKYVQSVLGNGIIIKKGLKITQEQANKIFELTIENKYCKRVDKYMSKYGFNENQYNALLSFAYNIGSIDQLTANGTRTINEISEKIPAYNKAGGKVLQGLIRRRTEEKELFDANPGTYMIPAYRPEKIEIIETGLAFRTALAKRKKTDEIVLHHAASKSVSVETIHSWHLSNGWSGIGYHFYIRKDGKVYRGRPVNTVGAHCTGHNNHTIGVCFEGNFQEEQMPGKQIVAGQKLLSYLFEMYGLSSGNVKKHKDHMATSCPGANFPFETIRNGDIILNQTNEQLVNTSIETSKFYTVVKGDTLTKIGKKVGINWKAIANINDIQFPYIISVGQVLKLSCINAENNTGYNAKITAKSGLNMRNGAGESYNKVIAIPRGKKVFISRIKNGWGYTCYNNRYGWIYLMYTKRV